MLEAPAGTAALGAAPVFLDTSILVDCADRHDVTRQHLCRDHVRGLQRDRRAVISTQILQEFYVVATRKLGLPEARAHELLTELRRLPTVTPDLIEQAIECHQAATISFWDALIVVAAASAGCTNLLSADLNAGQAISGVRVVDPADAVGI